MAGIRLLFLALFTSVQTFRSSSFEPSCHALPLGLASGVATLTTLLSSSPIRSNDRYDRAEPYDRAEQSESDQCESLSKSAREMACALKATFFLLGGAVVDC